MFTIKVIDKSDGTSLAEDKSNDLGEAARIAKSLRDIVVNVMRKTIPSTTTNDVEAVIVIA